VTSGADPAETPAQRPTRITYVVDSFAYGGAEAYLIHLLRSLPERFGPTLVATLPVPRQLTSVAAELSVPVATVDAVRGKLDLVRLVRQTRVVRATHPDLVHVNMTTAANGRHVIGALVTTATPVVATLHSVAPVRSALQAKILRAAYRRLASIVAVSEGTRRQLCDELGINDRRVRIIANGVETHNVPPRSPQRTVRIGSLGRLTHEKGFDLLVDAVAQLVSAGEEIAVSLGGEGVEREALERRAQGLPIDFTGHVEDVEAFLAALDVFCLPSRWEGLPFSLLEAMMSGLPCVAADVGDIAVALGDAGIVVPPENVSSLANALKRLVDSPAERLQLGSAAHARAKARFSVQAMVRATVALYDESLAR